MAERLLLQNGVFYRTGGRCVRGDLLIRDGHISEVGPNLRRSKGVFVCDLEGRLALPGLIDAHLHLEKVSSDLEKVHLGEARTVADVLSALEARAASTPKGAWIQTYDEDCTWSEKDLQESRLPRAEELDRVLPDHPALISSGNRGVLNTFGIHRLLAMSLDSETEEALRALEKRVRETIEGETFIKAIKRAIPPPDGDHRKNAVIHTMRALNRVGITGVVDPGRSDVPFEESWRLYSKIVAEKTATVRVALMARFPLENQGDRALSFLQASDIPTTERMSGVRTSPWLCFGGVKLIVDGEIETGWFRTPLPFPYGERTMKYLDNRKLFPVAQRAAARGHPVGIHALGGGAIDAVLDVLSAVDQRIDLSHLRFSLVYAFFPDKATFDCCRQMGIIASLQQPLVYTYAPEMLAVWGSEKAQQANPVHTWLNHGIPVAAGSDVLPFNPLLGIWSLVTRGTRLGTPLGTLEAVSISEAIDSYTWGGACLTRTETMQGALEVGCFADMAVLSENIIETPPESIPDVEVEATFVAGQCVYNSGAIGGLAEIDSRN